MEILQRFSLDNIFDMEFVKLYNMFWQNNFQPRD